MLAQFFEFGPYRIDTERRRLVCHGSPIPLAAKSVEVLLFLVQNNQRTVSKDELLQAVWHGEVVEESNLSQHIYTIRHALKEGASEHQYILTVWGKGYTFIAPVHKTTTNPHTDFQVFPAYQAYAKGRFFLEKRNEEGFRRALQHFQHAIALDPTYAAAHVGVARSYALLAAYQHVEPGVGFPRAREAARKALEIDSQDSNAHTALGEIALFYERDWESAQQTLSHALVLNPNDVDARDNETWLSIALCRLDEAHLRAKAALALDPSALHLHATLGLVYQYMGLTERAVSHFKALIEMDSDYRLGRYYLGSALIQCGEFTEAVGELERVAAQDASPQNVSSLSYAYGVSGDKAVAQALLESLEKMRRERYVSPYSLAIAQIGLGQKQHALESLRAACAESAPWLIFLSVEPRFDALRGLPEFHGILKQLGLPPVRPSHTG